MKFQPGDKVKRRYNVYDENSLWRYGKIVCNYKENSKFGYYPELYEVIWDDGVKEIGFLPHGLDKVL